MDWIAWAKEAGAYVAPLLMGAVIWQEKERLRLVKSNEAKSTEVKELAEVVITIATELKVFLFNERKA